MFEDALAGVDRRPGGRVRLRRRRRPGRAGRGAARARRRRRRLRPRRAAGARMIEQPDVRGRAVVGARDAARPRRARADRVGVRALERAHRPARRTSTRASRSACPGTYLNSFYELRPLPHAEAGYGYPESGQTIVNVTNGKIIRLLVDDEPFDVRYGKLLSARARARPARRACCAARVEWVSPAGDGVRVRSTRLVSFAQRAVAGDPLRGRAARRAGARRRPVGARRQRAGAARDRGDPRAAAALESPLQSEEHSRTTSSRRARPLDAGAAGCGWRRHGPRRRRPGRHRRRRPRARRTSAA